MKKWLKSRLARGVRPRPVLCGLLSGLRLHLDPNHQAQLWLGLAERETHPWLKRLGRRCGSLVDLGAGDGELTVWALATAGLTRVVAVEIDEASNRRLRENLRLNGLEACEQRELTMVEEALQVEGTAGRTLLDVSAGLPEPILLKVDIDGPEADLLEGSRAFLAGKSVCLLVETHARGTEARLVKLLAELGYQTRIIHPAWWRVFIPEHRKIAHNRWLAAWK